MVLLALTIPSRFQLSHPAQDFFYISRINDPTTYFSQWLLKKYDLRLKAEPVECPICLEQVPNSIQLSCG